ncbi:NAD(P)H-dependent glycerol-3-phosphate dehydrogenase [Geothrix sp. 21YS21S-2]|uniref:NAD(P)H-dependent glycerol-3-phosphate dehydrogenase n=1 Tax=Geothrix sp. 21YS21S-2 TaxID=3068893 RepID=UPI0027B8B6DB|nr:NAD(P)H-dependent glycerol-3-phosphate dehydrogenase [Geothrix sp. 21YS21S-2]
MSKKPDITIFGSGAWGTALAIAWARQGARVDLWGHPPSLVTALATTRRHPSLADVEIPQGVRPILDPEDGFRAGLWVTALPTQVNPKVWTDLASRTASRPELLVSVSKGILQGSFKRVSETLEGILGVPVGVFSGPTFADEVSRAQPSAIVLALPAAIPDDRAAELQALLATPALRVYLSRDVAGVELCGAFKNVLAIAAGLVESLGLGNNARAALITRGLAEMSRLVEALGGTRDTLMGLAGLGDLVLTATGPQSRNRTFGALVGKGMTPEAAAASLGNQVVEGAFTAEAALGLARSLGVELPITQEVVRLLEGADPRESVNRLMQRSLKPEAS